LCFARFLETYPLYRNFKLLCAFESRASISKAAPAIHTVCVVCKAERTLAYSRGSRLVDGMNLDPAPGSGRGGPNSMGTGSSLLRDVIAVLSYRCNYCNECERIYFVKFDEDGFGVMKVGQFPGWDISVPKNSGSPLLRHQETFKKGLISESQGFGIGAYGYYRRIVELTIDELLDSIPDLLQGDEKARYENALLRTKQTVVAQDKIELVKDLLPASLRPNGMNPLSVLHGVLSEGLHALSDEECLELAETVRTTLLALVSQIATQRDDAKKLSDAMRKLLDRRNQSRSEG
jgi:hypothetical protein